MLKSTDNFAKYDRSVLLTKSQVRLFGDRNLTLVAPATNRVGEVMNGTYGFVYCGALGVGMEFLKITGSELVGCSLAGGDSRGVLSKIKRPAKSTLC